jgi:hypothetical protein
LFAASQPGNELQKFWRNSERIGGKERSGSRTRRKKERRTEVVSKQNAKSGPRADDGLGNTDANL